VYRAVDLSLGQRLAIGFALLLVLLGGLFVLIFTLQQRSISAQATFVDRIAPRREAAQRTEVALLRVGVAARAYLLTHDPAHRQQFESSASVARAALDRLTATPKDADDEKLFATLQPLIIEYLGAAEAAVRTSPSRGFTAADDAALSARRERALASVQAFFELQHRKAAAVVDEMAAVRSGVTQSLLAASVVGVILFTLLAMATIQSVRQPARELLRIAGALEAGNAAPALVYAPRPGEPPPPVRSEMMKLARAFGAAARALERRADRLRADGRAAAAAASSLQKDDLAADTLRAVVEHVGAEVAVIYWRDDESGRLLPIATHAVQAAPLAIGEGIPGQAARSARTVILRDVPRETPFAVKLGYDQAPPRSVVAVPSLFGRDVQGVLLVGALHDLDDEAVAFVESTAVHLAVGLQNARAHERVERLVTELKASYARIQEQSEELQGQNEELQAQHEELQAQSEELQAQNEELQVQRDEIHAHTHLLEEQGVVLREQAAQLLEADERKNEFLGVLAHELRNPMAPITMSLYILRHAPSDSTRAERALAVLERQARHLTRLIDDLLDVTRISRGKVRIEREPLELGELARTCVDDQQAAIESRNLALEVDLPSETVWTEGDRTRLSQILNNLLSNAVKFTDPGGRVTLRLTADPAGREAVLEVKDTGIGIDPALLPRLFQPFSQGASGLARTNGGLGLGLALVKALAELHGGSVDASSEGPGRGSTFTVRLPTCAAPDARPFATRPRASRRRVLLVEDNVDAAVSLREALELMGHAVEVAHSGDEGLLKAGLFRPDVVLCDIGLPSMDGYEFARALRTQATPQPVLLVALTGYAASNDRSRAFDAGFDRHLAKPLDIDELERLLAPLDEARPT
jgi:signal transduction histidine kinase/ActR/RegA family two-component response regulator/CHASE3 domain sensor protein